MILASTPCVADDAGHLLTVFLLAAVIPYSSGCSNLHTLWPSWGSRPPYVSLPGLLRAGPRPVGTGQKAAKPDTSVCRSAGPTSSRRGTSGPSRDLPQQQGRAGPRVPWLASTL